MPKASGTPASTTAMRRGGPIDWPAAAMRLAEAFPRNRLDRATLAWAEAAPAREPWAVALSGGADSLTALLLVWAYWPARRQRLRVLHFNHRLRGAAARADERFCARVAAALGLTYRTGRWDEAPRQASEGEARAARQAFFDAELRRAKARALWLGHQMDDVAETMLMRLARGSGSGGLAAPRPVQPLANGRVNLRPLLGIRKMEIVAALRAAGVPWREDATNAGGDYFRNRIRHEVMPAWIEAAQRDALGGAALARRLLEEDDAALDAWLEEVAPTTKTGALSLRRLAGKPRALVRRALRRWLTGCAGVGELSRQAFEALLDDVLARRRTRHSIGAGCFARITRSLVVSERAAPRKISTGFHAPAN